MTDDNDVDANEGDFNDTLRVREILGVSFMATPSLDLDLAFCAVDCNADLARNHLFSSPSLRLFCFSYCCWGALLRSSSFHYNNHLLLLLVAVI